MFLIEFKSRIKGILVGLSYRKFDIRIFFYR